MPSYRDPNSAVVYQVTKVQTCSGQPLEVTTASGQYTYIAPATTAGDAFGRTALGLLGAPPPAAAATAIAAAIATIPARPHGRRQGPHVPHEAHRRRAPRHRLNRGPRLLLGIGRLRAGPGHRLLRAGVTLRPGGKRRAGGAGGHPADHLAPLAVDRLGRDLAGQGMDVAVTVGLDQHGVPRAEGPQRPGDGQGGSGGPAAAGGPLAQLPEALAELLAAAVAMGQQPQQALLLGVRPALQLKRHPEGASFAETEQGPHPPAQGPGGPGHHRDLQPQGQLPTGGMGTGGGPQGAQRGGAVVAGGGAAIGAGQVQHPAKLQGLQGRRHRGRKGGPHGRQVNDRGRHHPAAGHDVSTEHRQVVAGIGKEDAMQDLQARDRKSVV